MFWDDLKVPSLRVKGGEAGNTYVHSYIGNVVIGDWFSENVMLTKGLLEMVL
jgi:hypothetical protein